MIPIPIRAARAVGTAAVHVLTHALQPTLDRSASRAAVPTPYCDATAACSMLYRKTRLVTRVLKVSQAAAINSLRMANALPPGPLAG
eukprot:SAG25_NODE_4856_length_740_cov_1.316693_2_plen_87_part_00